MVKAKIKDQDFELVWDSAKQQMLLNGETWDWNLVRANQLMHLNAKGKRFVMEWLGYRVETKLAEVKVNGTHYSVSIEHPFDALLKKMGFSTSHQKKQREVKAPMPGMVLNVLVQPGDLVQKDTPLLVLEAMKMENVIKSPIDGAIKEVKTIKGQAVEKGSILIEFS